MLYISALMASWALQVHVPIWSPHMPLWGRALGGGLIAFGLMFDFSAMLALHRARTTILPNRAASALVTTWPFSVSRNPIYLGNTLVLTGLALVLVWPWLLIMTAASSMLVSKLAIEREERHLKVVFGEAWQAYRSRVPRWILAL